MSEHPYNLDYKNYNVIVSYLADKYFDRNDISLFNIFKLAVLFYAIEQSFNSHIIELLLEKINENKDAIIPELKITVHKKDSDKGPIRYGRLYWDNERVSEHILDKLEMRSMLKKNT